MLTYIRFIITSAMSDLLRNKLRTFLTSLGILIGVSSVVLLIAFGVGLKNFIKNQFDTAEEYKKFLFEYLKSHQLPDDVEKFLDDLER